MDGVSGMWLQIVDNKQLCYSTDLTNCRFCILTVQFRNGKLSYDMAYMLCFVGGINLVVCFKFTQREYFSRTFFLT